MTVSEDGSQWSVFPPIGSWWIDGRFPLRKRRLVHGVDECGLANENFNQPVAPVVASRSPACQLSTPFSIRQGYFRGLPSRLI
jgi:hypothetical protein